MKYYLDENLTPDIAGAGRALGLDVVSAHECGARGVSDENQLARAAAEGRCLVTFRRQKAAKIPGFPYRDRKAETHRRGHHSLGED